jgi:hypothetical protein
MNPNACLSSKPAIVAGSVANLVIVSVIVWPQFPFACICSHMLHRCRRGCSSCIPLLTVIANSKLLVLPAYPVAWPQAKKHVWVQGTFRYLHRMAELDSMRKTAQRYQQTKQAFAQSGDLGVWMKYIKSRHLSADCVIW